MIPWCDALETLTAAPRARIGQIAMLDRHQGLVLNILCGTSPDEDEAYLASGGPDPRINPRTRAVLHGASLRCQVDEDFITSSERDRSAIYRGLFARSDVPHACMTRLDASSDARVALGLLRPASSGVATADERRLIESLAPALRGLIEASLRLGTAQDTALLRTVEHLASPALLLGCDMTLLSTSPSAEALLAAGTHLTVRNGRLTARGAAGAAALEHAFRTVTCSTHPEHATVSAILPPTSGATPLAVELCGLPARAEGPLSLACAVLTIRVPRRHGAPQQLLQASFDLTPAEAAVAAMLAEGRSVTQVAEQRGCAVATVRTQVKALFEKTGTARQVDLVLKIKSLQ